MNIKKISSIALASLMLYTGIPNLTVFADDNNNISSQNISSNSDKEENFTEKLIIDNQEYEYDYKFEGENNTIQIKGENEDSNITFNSKTNKMYVNGKFATTVEKEISNLEDSSQAKSTWKYQDTTTFRLNFIGTESKAILAGMIAAACKVPASVILGGIGVLVGVAGFCSFKQDFYKHVSASRNYKSVLKIYSDRNWGQYEGSVTHYAVV